MRRSSLEAPVAGQSLSTIEHLLPPSLLSARTRQFKNIFLQWGQPPAFRILITDDPCQAFVPHSVHTVMHRERRCAPPARRATEAYSLSTSQRAERIGRGAAAVECGRINGAGHFSMLRSLSSLLMRRRWAPSCQRPNFRDVILNRACHVGFTSSQYAFSSCEKASLRDSILEALIADAECGGLTPFTLAGSSPVYAASRWAGGWRGDGNPPP